MSTHTRKRIITIGGRPGSGKSTASKEVATLLGLDHFSSGDFLRAMAKERGLTIEGLNKLAETDPSIDEAADAELRRRGEEEDNLIIDSRLAFHWIPNSFKVYLDITREEAARRIFADKNESRLETSDQTESFEEALESIEERLKSERKRYKDFYGVDPYDPSHYDLVIDTGLLPADAVAARIVERFNEWLEN